MNCRLCLGNFGFRLAPMFGCQAFRVTLRFPDGMRALANSRFIFLCHDGFLVRDLEQNPNASEEVWMRLLM